jgi:hypothetical protein
MKSLVEVFLMATRQQIIDETEKLFHSARSQSLRTLYYRLVSRGVVSNTPADYQAVSDALGQGRQPSKWSE